MIPRSWRFPAAGVIFATLLGILFSRLSFVPVPWPDSSAFYLPGLDLIHWPPQWRMHAQAAFVPTYDQANFNIMPALSTLLGVFARLGFGGLFGPEIVNRALSLTALAAWAWLLWTWILEAGDRPAAQASTRRWLLFAASAVALAGLWDPVIRWGTMVVRTEIWIGLCWLACLREIWFWEAHGKGQDLWRKTSWRISLALALAAYFHFEAVYLVPATALAIGWGQSGPKRLIDVAWRTLVFLSPWLAYAALNSELVADQMQTEFSRLSHHNHWLNNAYSLFHGLFLDMGSPSGWPKYFNVAKAAYWFSLLLLIVTTATMFFKSRIIRLRRTFAAAALACVSCFYLWGSKDEVWFITLCHLTLWTWMAALAISLRTDFPGAARAKWIGCGGIALSTVYAIVSLSASFSQAGAISTVYTWPNYHSWVDCVERAIDPSRNKSNLRVWQPYAPDVLVELSRRHPDWDLTRALDFQARRDLALKAAAKMDAVVMTRFFNVPFDSLYIGPPRLEDIVKMSSESELPFGRWAVKQVEAQTDPKKQAVVCERGPFWAVVLSPVL